MYGAVLCCAVMGISVNPKFWSGQFMNFLGQNVAPGLLPARQAYLSVTELESRISAGLNAYDQYEVRRSLPRGFLANFNSIWRDTVPVWHTSCPFNGC